MESYEPQKIEPKWQKHWEKKDLCKAEDFSKKPKLYLLVEFPYASGAGLHVGHCRSYVALDVVARKKRMEGYNVLFPMGWDAFGLPTENYAVKTGIQPQIVTQQNTAAFKKQEKMLGLSFDWEREINSSEPEYYKWTQWIFLKLFEQGLAYKARIPINWCPACKIGLANEEVVEGKCERCGAKVTQKEKEQWLLKITKYADRLLDDLTKVDFPERVKALQKDWIGRSEGWEISFKLKIKNEKLKITDRNLKIDVFTTRIDTIFGCTYLVVAPEYEIITNYKLQITNYKEVAEYIKTAKGKSELERQVEAKEKTGVKLEGVVAINPANGKEIPIFIADYVLLGYGTGAIMAVPAHDQRDFEFAKKYNLPIVEVIKLEDSDISQKAFLGEGRLVNSEQFNGLKSVEAMEKIGQWLMEKDLAKEQVNYKLRDWVFSRQRYWGEPIPLVFCDKCALRDPSGQGWVAVPEKDLPVELPKLKDFKPTESGESPLAKVEKWVNTKCPKCGGPAKRETDVMPNWAGSNWYFLAYTMRGSQKSKVKSQKYKSKGKSDEYIWDKEKMKYWMPVDWYNGGMEHTTLHLLYSRFIYKFLWDIGAVPKELGPEPYKKRTSHGMILAEGGVKMSKSKGNVLNPDDVVKQYGADTLRIYEMFMGPFEQAIAWDTKGVRGVQRFLKRTFELKPKVKSQKSKSQLKSQKLEKLLHKTIKKVSEDIEAMKFNTAISALMILVRGIEKEETIPREIFEKFLLILSPFAPHLAEELWNGLGNPEGIPSGSYGASKQSIFLEKWPEYDIELIRDEQVVLIVQVNGKVRGKVRADRGVSEQQAKEAALRDEKVKQWLSGKEIKKIVFVEDKLINFVI